MNNNPKDMKASGSVRLSGGAYRDVNISGSAHIAGDIDCESFHASGSSRVDGSIKTGECHISGSGSVSGSLDAAAIQASGSVRVDGDTSASDEVHTSGSAHFGGALKARSVQASGSLKVGKGIECETLTVSGSIDVDGLINAGTTDILLAGQSRLDEIGGESVTVRRRLNVSVLGIQLPASIFGGLTANAIEGNVIRLEGTRAKVVRGADVTIGAGCEIDRVEYSAALNLEGDAVVREQVKVD